MVVAGELCDDGSNDNLGCSTDCLDINPKWTCSPGSPTSASICSPYCGDGFKVGNEVCDDANSTDNKGCTSDCLGVITGYACSSGEPS